MESTYEKVKAYYHFLNSEGIISKQTAVDFRKDGIYIGGKIIVYRSAIDIMAVENVRGYALALAHISTRI